MTNCRLPLRIIGSTDSLALQVEILQGPGPLAKASSPTFANMYTHQLLFIEPRLQGIIHPEVGLQSSLVHLSAYLWSTQVFRKSIYNTAMATRESHWHYWMYLTYCHTQHANHKIPPISKKNIAAPGFDPGTSGLWALRASAAPCRSVMGWLHRNGGFNMTHGSRDPKVSKCSFC
jgi:hypothetical protein